MAALLPPCVHLPDPNEYALCSLFSISCMALSLHPPPLPHTSFSPLCMVHSLPPNPTPPHPPPRLTPSTPSPSLTPLYVLLHGLWPPRRLAWHWPPTPQDHSGTLGAEEFKACLISLGFDIANDAQVLNRSSPPPSAARSLTGFSFFVLSPPCISILPYSPSILPLFPPLLFIPPVEMPFVIFHPLQRPLCGSLRLSSLTLLLVHPFLFQSLSSTIPATLPSSWFHLPIADLVEEIRNHGCGRLQNLPYLHWLQPGKAMSTLPSMNICLCVINETKLKW